MERNYLTDVLRSRKTIVEMLEKRGYSMKNTEENIDFKTFEKLSNHDIIDDNSKIYVHYISDNVKLNTEEMDKIIDTIKAEYGDINIIIIYTIVVSGILIKHEMKDVELFKLDEVIINISKHNYVPEHTIIYDDEINEILNTFSTTLDKLPRILHTDPMIRFIGAKKGDVVKIKRRSSSAGIYYYYRLCE